MKAEHTFRFTTTLVQWHNDSGGAWHFIGVTGDVAEALSGTALMRRLESGRRAGFGAVKLTIRIGRTEWQTSAFPIKETGWSIPISAKVRKAEGLVVGDSVDVTLSF